MHNKEKKLKLIEKYHKKVKDDYIFSAMMADDKNDLIKAVLINSPKFWYIQDGQNSRAEGADTKFDNMILRIIEDNGIKIEYEGSEQLGSIAPDKNNIIQNIYSVEFTGDYEEMVAFITAVENDDRIYYIKSLTIKNPFQKNYIGVHVQMQLYETNLGKINES